MNLILTVPLNIKTKTGRTLELMPVVMSGMPSSRSDIFVQFLKTGSPRIEIDDATVNNIQAYMRKHKSEAVTEDGNVAWTIAGLTLVECDPDVANSMFDQQESDQ